jgi:hypothetical protein
MHSNRVEIEEKKKADSCHKLDVTTFASLEGFLSKSEGRDFLCGKNFRYYREYIRSIWFGFSLNVEVNFINDIKISVHGMQATM